MSEYTYKDNLADEEFEEDADYESEEDENESNPNIYYEDGEWFEYTPDDPRYTPEYIRQEVERREAEQAAYYDNLPDENGNYPPAKESKTLPVPEPTHQADYTETLTLDDDDESITLEELLSETTTRKVYEILHEFLEKNEWYLPVEIWQEFSTHLEAQTWLPASVAHKIIAYLREEAREKYKENGKKKSFKCERPSHGETSIPYEGLYAFSINCNCLNCSGCRNRMAHERRAKLKWEAYRTPFNLVRGLVDGTHDDTKFKRHINKELRKSFPGEEEETHFTPIDPRTIRGLEHLQVIPMTPDMLSKLPDECFLSIPGRAISGKFGDRPEVKTDKVPYLVAFVTSREMEKAPPEITAQEKLELLEQAVKQELAKNEGTSIRAQTASLRIDEELQQDFTRAYGCLLEEKWGVKITFKTFYFTEGYIPGKLIGYCKTSRPPEKFKSRNVLQESVFTPPQLSLSPLEKERLESNLRYQHYLETTFSPEELEALRQLGH